MGGSGYPILVTLMTEEGEGDVERPDGMIGAGEELGDAPAPGTLICAGCGYAVSLEAIDSVPACPACDGREFRRAPLFERTTLSVDVVEVDSDEPSWLEEVRSRTPGDKPCLAYRYSGETRLLELEPGWVRIGRSPSAQLRLDDATVSRRHALVVLTDEGELRALDDRSLNGLFVNGERVEWAKLGDGDELEIGRYRVVVLR